MKVVILAGGFGTRISEESAIRPKPLIEIGGQPILWHIMKIYSVKGLNDFVICGGYKCNMLKSYFREYMLSNSDVTFDLQAERIYIHHRHIEPWRVTVVDTGERTMTGGRLKRVRPYLDDQTFCMTYGDGVADIDVAELIEFHTRSGALATVTAISPPGRFGVLGIDADTARVNAFREKSNRDVGFINGGFFVLEPEVYDYITDDDTVWELEPMEKLAREGHLAAYRHRGFWQNMDSLRDKHVLESLWQSGEAPWRIWS
jgi:glucose-1-phosphate cytidylyltransferase